MLRKLPIGILISCALIATAPGQQPAASQTNPSQAPAVAPSSPAKAANPDAVGMDQAVITLKGGCQPVGNLQPTKDCVTTVTREQFEKLTNAIQPGLPADAKRTFAGNYGRLLVFYNVAQALHLENDPTMQLIISFVAKQVYTEGVKRHYAEEYAHPTDEQVQAYYNQNSAKYKEMTLQRIVIPRKQVEEGKPQPTEAEEKAFAEKLRARWTAGEDGSKLQQEAYANAGLPSAGAPDVSIGPHRAGTLPVNQEPVFQLKAGEVSEVFAEPGVSFLYKSVSVREIPLSEERDAIVKALQDQKVQDKLQEISSSATPELNETYFGPATSGSPHGRPLPGAGTSPHGGNPPQ